MVIIITILGMVILGAILISLQLAADKRRERERVQRQVADRKLQAQAEAQKLEQMRQQQAEMEAARRKEEAAARAREEAHAREEARPETKLYRRVSSIPHSAWKLHNKGNVRSISTTLDDGTTVTITRERQSRNTTVGCLYDTFFSATIDGVSVASDSFFPKNKGTAARPYVDDPIGNPPFGTIWSYCESVIDALEAPEKRRAEQRRAAETAQADRVKNKMADW